MSNFLDPKNHFFSPLFHPKEIFKSQDKLFSPLEDILPILICEGLKLNFHTISGVHLLWKHQKIYCNSEKVEVPLTRIIIYVPNNTFLIVIVR
jgi:hypothetical protein